MKNSPWQQRAERAEYLAERYPSVAEILHFYAKVARFQDAVVQKTSLASLPLTLNQICDSTYLSSVLGDFESLLSLAEKIGPKPLRENARLLRTRGPTAWSELLNQCWLGSLDLDAELLPDTFLARAFLQPYAELARERMPAHSDQYPTSVCAFCGRRPGLGLLRPLGDGARRSLLCSFCLAEWEFRRIVCPQCGEEDNQKLPVYLATDFSHIRVECCDTCRHYMKTVDLTKEGLAESVVDEIAAVPLDLWAREHGYSKLEPNLLGM